MRSPAFLVLACAAAFSCTPIHDVTRAPPGAQESMSTNAPVLQPDAAVASDAAGSTMSFVGTVVTEATPCAEEGAHACGGHGVREVSVCKGGVWTADVACQASERCDSTQGVCLPLAAVCSGQQPGAHFCDGDRRLVCDDLVAARELSCGPNALCLRKNGQVSCMCAPGAVPSASGMGCDLVNGCDANGGGCDALTQCVSTASNQSTCTPCPDGYVGRGETGCIPQLKSLSVLCGPDWAPRTMDLTPGIYEYRVHVPMPCQQVMVTAAAPSGSQLEVDGSPLEAAAAWSSAPLKVGDNLIRLMLSAASGRSSTYQLQVERSGSKSDYLKASNPEMDDSFGFGIAADGSTLVVGAPWEDSNGTGGADNSVGDAGGVFVFELENDKWLEKQLVKPEKPDPGDMFGGAVAISGDLMVVGAPRYNMMLFKLVPPTEPGVAYVFARQGGVWKQEGTLDPSPSSGADMFGFHVAVHGETVLVGAPYDSQGGSHAGAVYSFARNGGAWMLQQKILASSPVAEASFGVSMAIEGDVFVVGAMQDSSVAEAAGSAYIFTRSAGMWSQQDRLQAPMPRALATFGTVTAIHHGQVVVAAPGLDLRQRQTPPGAAYLFRPDPASSKWGMVAQFQGAVPRSNDLFGGSLAITASAIIVGANGDASTSRGVDGDASRTDAPLSGAAYMFGLQGSEYVQTAYLKAFNAEANDGFGHSMAATESFVAVAAPFEAGAQRGPRAQDAADGNSNSAPSSGAVYVYR